MKTYKLYQTLNLLPLLLILNSLSAQSFTARVLSSTGTPIEFATVYIKGTSCGTHTDQAGKFVLECPSLESLNSRSLIVSFIGYNSLEIPLDELEKNSPLFLAPTSVELATVEVLDRQNLKMEEFEFKYAIKRPYSYYQTNVTSNYQLASRIANKDKRTGYLSELKFKVGKAAAIGTPTRILFYDVDTTCDCPGKPLHQEDIIVELKRGTNKIDLKETIVQIPNTDFYLIFEWLHNTNKADKKLDFSIGMIPFKSEYPLIERKGGLDWEDLGRNRNARIWSKIKVLAEY